MNPVMRRNRSRALAPLFVACLALLPTPPALADSPPASSTRDTSIADQLRGLLDSHAVVQLRATENSTYGASLLFEPKNLNYFVALTHAGDFWRVIRTASEKEAESAYKAFAAQTASLGQVDIDTLRLQAGKRYAEYMVSINKQRLEGLQKDLARQKQQSQEVAGLQEQARQRAAALSAQLRATSSQLGAVQQNIRSLESEQKNPDLTWPKAGDDQPAEAGSTP